jgi:hypothetical protein
MAFIGKALAIRNSEALWKDYPEKMAGLYQSPLYWTIKKNKKEKK